VSSPNGHVSELRRRPPRWLEAAWRWWSAIALGVTFGLATGLLVFGR